jgi:hypothetical protein
MNDFDWVDDIPTAVHDGIKFTIGNRNGRYGRVNTVFTVNFIHGDERAVIVSWVDSHSGQPESTEYPLSVVTEYINNETWVECVE